MKVPYRLHIYDDGILANTVVCPSHSFAETLIQNRIELARALSEDVLTRFSFSQSWYKERKTVNTCWGYVKFQDETWTSEDGSRTLRFVMEVI